MIEDEYKIKPILEEYNCNIEVLKPLEDRFNKICGNYLDDKEGIRKAVFTEFEVCLKMALRDYQENNIDLVERIERIAGIKN